MSWLPDKPITRVPSSVSPLVSGSGTLRDHTGDRDGLLRLLLNPGVTGQAVTAPRGLAVLAGIREDPRADFLSDDSSLADADVDTTGLAGYKQVTAWHLLNLAVRHAGFLVTLDRKIARAASPTYSARILTLD